MIEPTEPTASSPSPSPSPSARRVSHEVSEEDTGLRADVVLGQRVVGLSRRQARNLARAGKLRVDGRRCPPATRVQAGQKLELDLDLGEARDAITSDTLEILRETERFIYVSKPAGIHTVALTPEQPGVLATAVAARFPECGAASPDPREGGAVHRLDRPTSGVVAFARSREAWDQARAGFSEERVAKHYLAVCTGPLVDPEHPLDAPAWPPPVPEGGLQAWLERPSSEPKLEPAAPTTLAAGAFDLQDLPSLRIRAALGRHEDPRHSAVRLDGRRARTLVRPLAQHGAHLLVRLLLETGRRHQARVHLAWIGLPIVKDRVYALERASADDASPAIHLHAFALDLSALFPDESPVIAPLPPGFWPPTSAPELG